MIRFENVTKTYDGQRRAALDNINVDIDKGEFVFLVGASGSGKSTFLRLILREQRPSKGKRCRPQLSKLHSWKIPAMRRQIGTVFQDFRLLPNKTVTDNVAFALQVIGSPQRPSSVWSRRSLSLLVWVARASGCLRSCLAASSSVSRSRVPSSTVR